MVSPADPWRQHRALKKIGVGSLLFLFSTFAIVTLGHIDMRSRGFHALVFGWIVFVLVMLTLTHEVRCPRCGLRFYAKGADFWQTSGKCLHCGQREYADVAAPTADTDSQ
jgi:DNA-directed RNA polymerase subunit RPC12/RpoP